MAAPAMSLQDWLDDLCVRFLVNLPPEHLGEIARICFAVEEAQWFYEDFIRPLDPQLPSMPLRLFCMKMFQHCPLLASFSEENHMKAFEEFMSYKTRVPVRGAIMLNQEMDSALLVKGWKKSSGWSFPRGKINKDEDDLECAIREVDEETGFDIRAAGLVPKDEPVKYVDIPMREQNIRLYVFRGVPMDTKFQPRTRKEISKIQWWKLSDLPTFKKKGGGNNEPTPAEKASKFYMVAPFLVHIRKWVLQQKKRDTATRQNEHPLPCPSRVFEEPVTEDDARGQASAPPPPKATADPQEVMTSLEDTTRELHRLLNIQPSTLPTKPPAAVSDKDKGASLLALLQPKSTPNASLTAVERPPFTPNHAGAQSQQPPASVHPRVTFSIQPQPFLVHPQAQPPQVRSLLAGRSQSVQSTSQQSPQRAPSGSYNSKAERSQDSIHPADEPKTGDRQYGNLRQHPQFIQATSMLEPPPSLSYAHAHTLFGGMAKPVPPTDKHRSALLDMFKKPALLSGGPRPDASPAGSYSDLKPGHPGLENWQSPEHGASGTGGSKISHSVNSSRALSNAADTSDQIHRGLLTMLTRMESQSSMVASSGSPSLPVHSSPRSAAVGASLCPVYPKRRVGSGIPAESRLFSSIYGAHNNSDNNVSQLTSPPPASALPPPSVLQSPPEHSTAHKQKLLSLFSRPSPSNDESQTRPPPPTQGPTTEAPISPADRSFLLGYLESVTSKVL